MLYIFSPQHTYLAKDHLHVFTKFKPSLKGGGDCWPDYLESQTELHIAAQAEGLYAAVTAA